jgi:hypothetical protein
LMTFALSAAMAAIFAIPAFAVPHLHSIILHPVIPVPTTAPPAGSSTIPTTSTLHSSVIPRLTATPKLAGFTESRIVTSSYLRMHEANVIVAMAAKVESGQMPKSSLVALAGQSAASNLLRSNLQPTIIRGSLGARPLNSPPDISGMKVPVPSWQSVQQVIRPLYTALPASDYGPQNIALGELKTGTKTSAIINLICPINCTITAKAQNSYGGGIRVTQIASYTGVWAPDSGRTGIYPTLDKVAGEGQSLGAQAGQDVSVTVNIASDSVNVFNTNIEIGGVYGSQAWSAAIPVTAIYTLLGPIQQIIAVPDRDVRCLAGQTIKMPVQLLNLGSSPTRATVTVANLPSSVTVEPITAAIPAASSVTKTLTFVVDPLATEDIGESLDVVVDAAGLHESHSQMSFSIYDPLHEFDIPNGVNAGGVNIFFATVGIGTDGTWYFDASAADTNQISGNQALVAFAFPGESGVGHGHWQTFSFSPNSFQSIDMNGKSKWVLDNYLSSVTLTPVLYMDVNPSNTSPTDTLSVIANVIQVGEAIGEIVAL